VVFSKPVLDLALKKFSGKTLAQSQSIEESLAHIGEHDETWS
jgi:hypothetical protein